MRVSTTIVRRLLVFIFAMAVLTAGPLLRAHHSEAAEFDNTKPVKVSGTLTKVEWANPHVWFYVDVAEPGEKPVTWGFSTQPPGSLMRRGIFKEALKIGSVVNVTGIRARDGSNNAAMRSLTFADGTQVLAPAAEGAR
jgi:Family of unknown function (DUF6152)